MLDTVVSYGASVRGPLHKKEGTPNEDAWHRGEGSFGKLVAVCDGMGSRSQARLGARAACLATREAVARWDKTCAAPLPYLVHLIELFWRLLIHPCSPSDAATTCLLALARPNGEWIVGGIGDGLAAVKTADAPVSVIIGDRREGFCNETVALGASPGMAAWQLAVVPPTQERRMAVLATDGVADDLIPEKLGDFCLWLADSFADLDPGDRWRRLVRELAAWPTPGHQDDKTLAVLNMSARQPKVIT